VFFDAHTHHFSKKNALVNIFYQESENIHLTKYCSLAAHPWQAEQFEANFIFDVEKFSEKNVLAVGETGLDKLCSADFARQKEIFLQHIKIAQKTQKPLILHAVRAHAEIISVLKSEKFNYPYMFHGFNQNENILKLCSREKNAFFSFGTALFYRNSNAEKALQNTPLEKVFFETDDSSTGIEQVYEKAAQILGKTVAMLQKQTEENFEHFFDFKKN
jgi:TatD DNase family protein